MNREAIYEQLKIDEGVVYEIYKDHLGYPTFGVGHLVLESDPEFGQDVGNIWNFMKLLTEAFLVVLTTVCLGIGCWAIEEWFLSIIISLRASKCINGHKRSL